MTGSGQSEGSHEGRIRTYLPAQGLGKGCSPQTTTLQGRPGAGKATKQSPPLTGKTLPLSLTLSTMLLFSWLVTPLVRAVPNKAALGTIPLLPGWPPAWRHSLAGQSQPLGATQEPPDQSKPPCQTCDTRAKSPPGPLCGQQEGEHVLTQEVGSHLPALPRARGSVCLCFKHSQGSNSH